MPETLFESRAIREFGPGSTLFSVGVHAVLITAALVSVSGRSRDRETTVPVGDVQWVRPSPVTRSVRTACHSQCDGFFPRPVLPLPRIPTSGPVASVTPDLGNLSRLGQIDFRAAEQIGGASVLGDATAPPAGQPWTADAVERVAVVVAAPEPRYPDRLRDAGVSGRVVARFIIDTTGRIEPASVAIVESSHDLFERAVRDVLPRMRFQPASVGNRRVRMLVEMPFEFRVR